MIVGKRKALASGNRVRTSLMLDANGQVVHSSSRRDRDRERGSRRESSSALRGGSRRLSLQEWILGSLPALPAIPYTRSAEEESQGLLEDPLSSASYGSVHGTDDPLVPVEGGRDTARAIPGAKLHEIAGMGHDLPAPLWPLFVDRIEAGRRCGSPGSPRR